MKKNRIIFKCMEDLFDRGIPVDTVSVLENLRQSKLLEKIGGEETIIYLAQIVPTTANVMYYTQIIKEKALMRALINASSEIVDAVRTIGDAQEVLEYAEKKNFFPLQKLELQEHMICYQTLCTMYLFK